MIVIVSPSKTQHAKLGPADEYYQPSLMDHTAELIRLLKHMGRVELSHLMKISPKLTDLTCERLQNFTLPHIAGTSGNALSTFQGDAFSAIDTDTYTAEDFLFAHTHLRILSGLYGFLRPLDLMQPYRLEMGTKLVSDRGKNLYEFWGSLITAALNAELETMNEQVIVNCASKEYSRVIEQKLLVGTMITITFKQKKNDALRSIAIYAKRARGMFVNYLIKNRINDTNALTGFDAGGYTFAPELSSSTELVFTSVLD